MRELDLLKFVGQDLTALKSHLSPKVGAKCCQALQAHRRNLLVNLRAEIAINSDQVLFWSYLKGDSRVIIAHLYDLEREFLTSQEIIGSKRDSPCLTDEMKALD